MDFIQSDDVTIMYQYATFLGICNTLMNIKETYKKTTEHLSFPITLTTTPPYLSIHLFQEDCILGSFTGKSRCCIILKTPLYGS